MHAYFPFYSIIFIFFRFITEIEKCSVSERIIDIDRKQVCPANNRILTIFCEFSTHTVEEINRRGNIERFLAHDLRAEIAFLMKRIAADKLRQMSETVLEQMRHEIMRLHFITNVNKISLFSRKLPITYLYFYKFWKKMTLL